LNKWRANAGGASASESPFLGADVLLDICPAS
jgi:hypothetical protein